MPRLPGALHKPRVLSTAALPHTRLLSATTHTLSSSSSSRQYSEPSTTADKSAAPAHDSRPGWAGREGRDHAVKRPPHDVQAEAAQQGMKDHAQGKQGSDAISRKDERKSQQKAKEEFPESPVVIGMNDERGSKGH